MRKFSPSLLVLSYVFSFAAYGLQMEGNSYPFDNQRNVANISSFEPFTGKIIKNKVRLRLQPAYDASVLREFHRNDLVVVLGETEDFYAIQAPSDMRGYVFRTYILDNVVEGKHVNVRLKPNLDAPIITQLNSGDRVEGSIDTSNNKWLEIKLPPQARFYIAKEYLEKAGDIGLLAHVEKKREDASQLLKATEVLSKFEMQKSFEQINIDKVKANYQHLIENYPEIPEVESKAKELLTALQESYTAKKIAYLEMQSQQSSSVKETNKKLTEELQTQKAKLANLEKQMEKNQPFAHSSTLYATNKKPTQTPANMASWLPVEEKLFESWALEKGRNNPNEFYEEQKQQAFLLKGMIDPYNRPVKNKPGDYMIINTSSKLPIAFLYSTYINLQDYVGREVSILVVPRPNHNFAFPAYFVLSVE